jgi:hypothetical protein
VKLGRSDLDAHPDARWRSPAEVGVRRLGAAVAAGALAGAVIGGVGGRLAMLALRMLSDPSLHGRLTDDGFTIGVVSLGTLFLLVLTTVGGGVGGAAYLAIRPWLPERARPWLFGTLAGLVGGAEIVRPGGIDFTLLEPLGLALAMFVAIPAAYGVVTGLLCERFLREGSTVLGGKASLAALTCLVAIALAGPLGLALAGTAFALVILGPRAPRLGELWRSTPATWLGRAALLTVSSVAAVELARDVQAVL